MLNVKIVYFALVINLSIGLISCNSQTSANLSGNQVTTPINAIAETLPTENIYITGTVIKIAPLLGNNAYQIQDASASIWVITTANLPAVGQTLSIKCQIKTQNIDSITQEVEELYLVELERLE